MKKKFVILDKIKRKVVRTYYGDYAGNLDCSIIPYNDLTKYDHREVGDGQVFGGFKYNDDGVLYYDTEYVEPKPSDFKPKIKNLTSVRKCHTEINYKTELEVGLFPKRLFEKGELQKVEWYSDEALTDKIIDVDITYNRDSQGFATDRTTTRTWINNNGTENDKKKITKKVYSQNQGDQIKEGKTRRQNIVDNCQMPVLSFMVETMIATYTPEEVILIGRDFMDSLQDHFLNFISNSSTVTDINSPDFGKKAIVVELESRSSTGATWLNNTPLQLDPTGGTSILDYLTDQFSI